MIKKAKKDCAATCLCYLESMQETSLTLAERQEIARAYIARMEAEAQERQNGRDFDVFHACTSASYKALVEHLIVKMPEAASLVKRAFLE